MYNNKMT